MPWEIIFIVIQRGPVVTFSEVLWLVFGKFWAKKRSEVLAQISHPAGLDS